MASTIKRHLKKKEEKKAAGKKSKPFDSGVQHVK